MASLMDLFSGYDQIRLAERSRDMTAFQSPIGLVRLTRLPQGWTGAVPEFMRVAMRILGNDLGQVASPFIDDFGVRGAKSFYVNEETLPGVRRHVYEHLRNIDKTLFNVELAGATVSGDKLLLCQKAIKIVGFVCDFDGRHPEAAKVIKILDWHASGDVVDLISDNTRL